MAGAVNPYAQKKRTPSGDAPGPVMSLLPHTAYTVPDIPESTDPEYTLGFSPELRPSSDGTSLPDNIRVGLREPPENDPNDRSYNRRRYADELQRVSDEKTVTGWEVEQRKLPKPIVPEWTQERMPIRPTATKSPLGYRHTRPWHIPRNVADAIGVDAVRHESLADHRRDYSIGGMAPRGILGINTFRLQPQPWDETLTVPTNNPSPDGAMSPVWGTTDYRL